MLHVAISTSAPVFDSNSGEREKVMRKIPFAFATTIMMVHKFIFANLIGVTGA